MGNQKRSRGSVATFLLMSITMLQIVFAPAIGSLFLIAQNRASVPAAIMYDNGGLSSGATSKSGTAAPAGFSWSELSTENGSTYSNTTLGAGCQAISTTTNNRCADDFFVPVGQTWTINAVNVYGYQTGSVANPFVGGNLRIWNGRPGDPGSTIVFGDTTTNRLGTPVDTTIYRIGNTLGGAGGVTAAATGTTRKIWQLPMTVSPALVLTAGNYWVDFQLDGGASGNFSPLTTVPGARSLPGWNARQFIGTTSTWGDLIDIGEPAAVAPNPQLDVVPNVLVSFPFKLDGTINGATVASASRSVDFNGDNKTDFSIARSASATAQTTWITLNSAGQTTGTDWGLGVGFGAGDKATPADFDGDGKTDVAVWRPGSALTARFYILNSATNTISNIPFGQTGDDVTVVDDYDGDGKADPSCYRAGATGTFYYRGSLNNPSGNITFVPWGTTGDVAVPGDYDGDGKADYTIVRNSGGNAQHWRRQSGGSTVTLQFGLTTDKFVTGDFDADGKTDVAAVRTIGSNYTWYIATSGNGSLLIDVLGNPATDFLVPGDYDGDNRTDLAVWRSGPSSDSAYFFVRNLNSSPAVQKWGSSTVANAAPDYPVATWNIK